ncbi:MAG TPA: thioredoxin domain-containing protein [Terriglobales bacterium]|nr:thioredoxin domain-containing protein [Terriglobales bacterium]
MRKFAIPILLSLAVLAAAQQKHTTATHATTSTKSPDNATNLPSEDEINGFLHETFGYNPQLTWKIVDVKPAEAKGLTQVDVQISSPEGQGGQRFFVTEDGKHAVVGDIIPFGKHPFQEARLTLQKKANGPARGPANAPVMIVEFSDLQCPHCKEANPTIERLLNENPNVRFVSQNFPLPSHNWAEKAAEYADCVGRASNDAYWKFVDGVFAAQEQVTADNADDKLKGIADSSGVNGADIAACAVKPDTQARVEASVQLGKELGVNSTPTLFVNGRPVGVASNNYDALKQLVDFAAADK